MPYPRHETPQQEPHIKPQNTESTPGIISGEGSHSHEGVSAGWVTCTVQAAQQMYETSRRAAPWALIAHSPHVDVGQRT